MTALRSSRALVALLLALLLAGRMVVPTGWMPVRTEQGLTIMLCSGSGSGEAWVDAAGKLHRGRNPAQGGKGEPKDPCPFGAISAPAALPAGPVLAALAPIPAQAPAPAPRVVTIGRGLAAPPPPATGPPYSA
jgi:hypothetical protein